MIQQITLLSCHPSKVRIMCTPLAIKSWETAQGNHIRPPHVAMTEAGTLPEFYEQKRISDCVTSLLLWMISLEKQHYRTPIHTNTSTYHSLLIHILHKVRAKSSDRIFEHCEDAGCPLHKAKRLECESGCTCTSSPGHHYLSNLYESLNTSISESVEIHSEHLKWER